MSESEQEQKVLDRLDSAERALVRFGRVVLWLALAGVVVGVVLAVAEGDPRGNTQGEYFYLGLAVLLVVGWIVRLLRRLGGRRTDRDR